MVSKSFGALEEPVRLTVQTAATIGTAFATETVVDSHPDLLSTAEVEAHLEAMQKYLLPPAERRRGALGILLEQHPHRALLDAAH
jgi:hypothetical protein